MTSFVESRHINMPVTLSFKSPVNNPTLSKSSAYSRGA